MTKHCVIFGSQGLIGSTLVRSISERFPTINIIYPTREQIISEDHSQILRLVANEHCSVFYCHGPTDPKIDFEIHRRFHVTLPEKWLTIFRKETRLETFMTFGSVHESHPELAKHNNYLRAKRLWLSLRRDKPLDNRHVQLHTLYGDIVRPHSFIGQMLAALQRQETFRMSAGLQKREYHHVKDIVDTLIDLSLPEVSESAGNDLILSHGHAISLRELAYEVFNYFHQLENLEVGAIPTPKGEILGIPEISTSTRFPIRQRPALAGIIELIKSKKIPH